MSLWTPLRAKPCNRRKWRYFTVYRGLGSLTTGCLIRMSLEPCPHCGVMAAWPPASVSCWIRWGVTWLLRPQLTTCSGRRWSPSDQYRAALRSLLLTGPAGQLWARAAAGAGDGESRRPSSVARARGLARLTALVRVATMVAPQPRPGPHTAQHAAHHRHLITTTAIQLETKVIRRFHKHGEGP